MTRAIASSLLAIAAATPILAQEDLRYSRDVRPILSRNCFQCHGPDAAERKADLRLDRPSEVVRELLVERVTHADPEERMPPRSSGKSLTPAQVDVLKRWVEAGARYERHWSFVPPQRPAVPEVLDANPIDRFVLAKHAVHGLVAAPPADRMTLVRRVYLDLIGLPPTPEEAAEFADDDRPDAYERLVDRLLASKAYGERWARRWLDIARYADTNGYEKDRNRSIWPYRDWVIRAINDDLPFDQFTVEQLAGDMLPDATPDQIVATGFHRNTMLNEEGGIDPLEFRFHSVTDRVATTGAAFLGLTTGCAHCHTHKFDPITHTEYYGLFAFLNNADEPTYFLPDEEWSAKIANRRSRASTALAALHEKWPKDKAPLEERFTAWLGDQRRRSATWSTLVPAEMSSNMPLLTHEGDGVVFVSGDTTKHDTYRLRFDGAATEVASIRIEALPDDRLPSRGPGTTFYEGRKGGFFMMEFALSAGDEDVVVASESYARPGGVFHRSASPARATDGDLQSGWSAGAIGERHVAVFTFTEPVAAGTPFEIELQFGRYYASSLGKFRVSASSSSAAEAIAFDAEIEPLLSRADSELTEEERRRLRNAFLMEAPEVQEHAKKVRDLRKPPGRMSTLVMRERPAHHVRQTHRHHRGEFLQPRERVEPHVPEVLHPWPDELPRNRLGFARWLASPDNPLFARVFVNRQWAAFFGRGIVTTLDDFGAQGATPTHPELLDWLAMEFVERGFRRKTLHRLIVTSATYRQSSIVTAEALARDPDNVWLSRAPRLRLDAEVLRDAALRAAGSLSTKMFGPPVRPPQPDGITEIAFGKPKWRAGKGEDRVRRSIYTFQKRTAPYALFSTFDAPSGEHCVVRRDTSNSALQALSLVNDPQMVEIAQAMGASLASRGGGDRETCVNAFERVLTRLPEIAELTTLLNFVGAQRERFRADAELASRVAGTDDDAIARATWTALARTLFALDEAVARN